MSLPGSTNVTPHESDTLNVDAADPLGTSASSAEEALKNDHVDARSSSSIEGEIAPIFRIASPF